MRKHAQIIHDSHLFLIPRIYINIANNITMIADLLQTKVGDSKKYVVQNIISTFATTHKMTSFLRKVLKETTCKCILN